MGSSVVSHKRKLTSGMTIVELLVAVMILLPLLTVVLKNFIQCMEMNEMAQQSSQVIWAERDRMATIEKTAFAQISSTYNGTSFSIANVSGAGVTNVSIPDLLEPDVLLVSISYVWTDRRGRSHNTGFSTLISNTS